MKNLRHLLALGLLPLMLACNNQKGPTNTSTSGTAVIICDQSFQNILDEEIGVFEYSYPDANILARYLPETDALDSLFDKKVDLVITSCDLTENQRNQLKAQQRAYRSHKIAVDAVAIIVNRENDIEQLSMDELKEIFTGKFTKWGQVTPTKTLKDSEIEVVFDGNGSGVINYMREKFVGKNGKFGAKVFAQNSTDEVFQAVEKHKNAIGFIGVSWISADMKDRATSIDERVRQLQGPDQPSAIDFTDRIKVMAVRAEDQLQARKPYQYYINNGEYPLVRVIWAIDASANGTLDHGFFCFLTSPIGQKIILQTGVLPAAEPVRMVEVN